MQKLVVAIYRPVTASCLRLLMTISRTPGKTIWFPPSVHQIRDHGIIRVFWKLQICPPLGYGQEEAVTGFNDAGSPGFCVLGFCRTRSLTTGCYWLNIVHKLRYNTYFVLRNASLNDLLRPHTMLAWSEMRVLWKIWSWGFWKKQGWVIPKRHQYPYWQWRGVAWSRLQQGGNWRQLRLQFGAVVALYEKF